MQSQGKRQKLKETQHKRSYLLLSLIMIFSVLIGILIGVAGVFIFQNMNNQNTEISNNNPVSSSDMSIDISPPGNGFFIIDVNGNYVKLAEINDDSVLDYATLPTSQSTKPIIAVKGNELPIGNLKLFGYYAGIGVDLSFTQSGALINTVFKNSPAQAAGLQPGEVILSVDGESVKTTMPYTLGKRDLSGLMKEEIVIEVVSGTNTRTVRLPRTFRDTVSELMSVMNPISTFTIEPKDDYLLIHTNRELMPGIYRFEFQEDEIMGTSGIFFESTPTPTLRPIPLPSQKWVFVVQ